MQLLVIRHAIAAEREQFERTGQPDELRPLTADGAAKMKRAAKGLRAVIDRLELIATSPLTRAAQTARIVADAYRIRRVDEESAFAPDVAPEAALAWVAELHRVYRREQIVAMVGHEPHLSSFVSLMLAGRSEPAVVELKKGGACLLALDAPPRPGSAVLHWLSTPRQLRSLA